MVSTLLHQMVPTLKHRTSLQSTAVRCGRNLSFHSGKIDHFNPKAAPWSTGTASVESLKWQVGTQKHCVTFPQIWSLFLWLDCDVIGNRYWLITNCDTAFLTNLIVRCEGAKGDWPLLPWICMGTWHLPGQKSNRMGSQIIWWPRTVENVTCRWTIC